MNHIESYFDGFVARYEKALKTLPYPSEKHMGITERNLTVNFACAVEKLSKNVITWYEVPINNTQKEKNDNHLDAVILDLDKAEIFLVESKRLREKKNARFYF